MSAVTALYSGCKRGCVVDGKIGMSQRKIMKTVIALEKKKTILGKLVPLTLFISHEQDTGSLSSPGAIL